MIRLYPSQPSGDKKIRLYSDRPKPTVAQPSLPPQQKQTDIPATYQQGAIGNTVGEKIMSTLPQTMEGFAAIQEDPLSVKVHPIKAIEQGVKDIVATQFDTAAKLAKVTQSRDVSEFLSNSMNAAGGLFNSAFSIPAAGFTAAEQIPILGTGFKLFNQIFKFAGDLGKDSAVMIVDNLPIKQAEKNKLISGVEAITTTAAMIIAGKAVEGKRGKLVEEFGAKDAKIIEQKAREVAAERMKAVEKPIVPVEQPMIPAERPVSGPVVEKGKIRLYDESGAPKPLEELVPVKPTKKSAIPVKKAKTMEEAVAPYEYTPEKALQKLETTKDGKFATEQKLKFDKKEYTIKSVIPEKTDVKYEMVDGKGKSLYTNQRGIESALMTIDGDTRANTLARNNAVRAIKGEKVLPVKTPKTEKVTPVKESVIKRADDITTTRGVAKDLIRGYVERGDTYEQLKGHMGSYSDKYHANINGDKILVEKVGTYEFDTPANKEVVHVKKSLPTKKELPTPVELTPETKPSKIGLSIEQNAIKEKLTKSFSETAQYDPTTVAEQAGILADLINSNPEAAKSMVRGEMPIPSRANEAYFLKAMEDFAIKTDDAQLMYDLANSPLTSETSQAAQTLRFAAERSPNSVMTKFQEVREVRTERAGKEATQKQRAETKDLAKKIDEPLLPKESTTWDNFLESIVC